MIPTGWNPALNNPPNGHNQQQQQQANSFSLNYSSGGEWYPNYNPSLPSSSSQPAGVSANIQKNHLSNYVYPSLSSSIGTYNPSSYGSSIAITFRVNWSGGLTSNLIMARPTVSIMAPKTAVFLLGSSAASPSLLRDGESTFATKLDDTSNDYYYFQQMYLLDEQELGLPSENNNDSIDMCILRLPFAYLGSLMGTPSSSSSAKAIGSSSSMNQPTAPLPPPWLDTVSLRQQLTRSLFNHNNSTMSSNLNLKHPSNCEDEILVHQVATFLELSLSKLGDWYPSMSITHIMGLVGLSENQLILVARGHVATSMNLLHPPLNVTRSISASSSTSSSHISDNNTSANHLLNITPVKKTSISPPINNSSYVGGGFMDTSSYSRGFGNFIGAVVGRDNEVENRNMGMLLPNSYDTGWTSKGSDVVQNMNLSFGERKETKVMGTTNNSVSHHSLYGRYNNLQEYYEDTDATRQVGPIQNKQSLMPIANNTPTLSSGRDIFKSSVTANNTDFSRSVAMPSNNNSSSNDIPLTASRFIHTNSSNDDLSRNSRTASPVRRSSSSRPDPAAVIPALLALGFTQRQCDAAVLAVKNAETPTLGSTAIESTTFNSNAAQHRFSDENAGVNHSYGSSISGSSVNLSVDDSSVIVRPPTSGKTTTSILRSSKSIDSVDNNPDISMIKVPLQSSSTTANTGQPKMLKMLDIPQEMNAFIFHCNANTRDECLERKVFG